MFLTKYCVRINIAEETQITLIAVNLAELERDISRVENSKNLAPLGIAENNILNSEVKKGEPIEIKNIDITDNQLYKYWLSQNS